MSGQKDRDARSAVQSEAVGDAAMSAACDGCGKPWGLCECDPRPAGKQAWIDKHMAVARASAANAATVDPQAEIAKLKHVISGLIPWVAGHGRGMAQEALADACEAIRRRPARVVGTPRSSAPSPSRP